MMVVALALLVGLVIFLLSRKGRSEFVVNVPSNQSNQTWAFNVRDMTAELLQTVPKVRIAYFDLRRSNEGDWEISHNTNPPVDISARIAFPTRGLGGQSGTDVVEVPRTWYPCVEPALSAIEDTYRRYNGQCVTSPELGEGLKG
jgi:hypothetical protein